MKTVTIEIFGETPEIRQTVRVKYFTEPRRDGFLEPQWFAITHCQILDEIKIRTTGLSTDIEEGIREHEGYHRTDFTLECPIDKFSLKQQ